MAKWLGIPSIVEGVETESQINHLKSLGCTMVQGFYFAKPISVYILKSNSNTNGLEMTEYQRTAENIVSAGLLIVISVALYAF